MLHKCVLQVQIFYVCLIFHRRRRKNATVGVTADVAFLRQMTQGMKQPLLWLTCIVEYNVSYIKMTGRGSGTF